MVDSRIVKYINDTLSAGYSEADVRKALVGQGWTPQEVEEAFSLAEAGQAPAKAAQKPAQAKQGDKAQQKPVSPNEQEMAQKAQAAPSGAQGPGIISGSFLMMAAGGALIIANSVMTLLGAGDLLALFMSNMEFSLMGMFDVQLSAMDSFLVNMIIGVFVLASSFIVVRMPDKAKITAAFVIVLSIISILIGNGFLIGGLVSVLGGVFTMLGK